MNLKSLAIPITMIVSFTLTVCVILGRESTPGNKPSSEPARAAPVARAAQPEFRPIPGTPQLEQPPAVVPDPDPVPDLSNVEVPIAILFQRVNHQGEPVAFVRNTSGKSLKIDITVHSPATSDTTINQIAVRPQEKKVLADLGVTILPGDQVTVHSLPYKDFQWQAH